MRPLPDYSSGRSSACPLVAEAGGVAAQEAVDRGGVDLADVSLALWCLAAAAPRAGIDQPDHLDG